MTENVADAAAELAAILQAENAALAALDLRRAGAMVSMKTHAAEAFLAARAASGNTGNAGGDRLAGLVEENRRLLRRAIAVQGRVIEVIARAVPRALHQAAPCYGAQGRARTARPPALAVSARA